MKKSILSKGKQCAAAHDLIIAGCARTCERRLRFLLSQLQKLGSYFRSCTIVIVENGSTDNTRRILEEEKRARGNVILPDHSSYCAKHRGKIDTLLSQNKFISGQRGSTRSRMLKMSMLRDNYLEIIQQENIPGQYLLMLDFDLCSIPAAGILHSLGVDAEDAEWDVITANGCFIKNMLNFRSYYDAYALESCDSPTIPFDYQIHLQDVYTRKLRKLAANQLLPVRSAFGGCGLYRRSIVGDIRYLPCTEEDDFAFCEHVSFHRRLREKHGARICINPAMKVYYNPLTVAVSRRIAKYAYRFRSLFQKKEK